MTTTTKISQFIKKENPSDVDAQIWAAHAATLAEAILQRVLAMQPAELLAFIADTEYGKRLNGDGNEKSFASAMFILHNTLMSPAENTSSNELTQADRDALKLAYRGVLEIRLLARELAASHGSIDDAKKIVAITDAMHNIPYVVGGFGQADQKEGALKFDVAELKKALAGGMTNTVPAPQAQSPQSSAPVSNTAHLKTYGLDAGKLGAAYEQAKITALRSDPDTVVIVNPSMSDADWSYVRELQESGHSVLLLAKVEHAPAETEWLGAPAKAA